MFVHRDWHLLADEIAHPFILVGKIILKVFPNQLSHFISQDLRMTFIEIDDDLWNLSSLFLPPTKASNGSPTC
jgi:hypothetical protein